MALQAAARQIERGFIVKLLMNELQIGTVGNQTTYRPGEEITGGAGWSLDRQPDSVEVRLFWHTDGKGTRDVGVAGTISFEHSQQKEARQFKFVAPAAPVSFSGKLISVIWSLELVALPSNDCARLDLVISPTGHEIILREADDDPESSGGIEIASPGNLLT